MHPSSRFRCILSVQAMLETMNCSVVSYRSKFTFKKKTWIRAVPFNTQQQYRQQINYIKTRLLGSFWMKMKLSIFPAVWSIPKVMTFLGLIAFLINSKLSIKFKESKKFERNHAMFIAIFLNFMLYTSKLTRILIV